MRYMFLVCLILATLPLQAGETARWYPSAFAVPLRQDTAPPQIQIWATTEGRVQISWTTEAGFVYQRQSSRSLDSADWRTDSPAQVGTGGMFVHDVPLSQGSVFYRILRLAPGFTAASRLAPREPGGTGQSLAFLAPADSARMASALYAAPGAPDTRPWYRGEFLLGLAARVDETCDLLSFADATGPCACVEKVKFILERSPLICPSGS